MAYKRQPLPPYFVVKALAAFRGWLLKLHRYTFPGTMVLYEQLQNLWILPSLYVAAELNIAELLRAGPQTPLWLAEQSGADPGSLYRVMRALASQGIFRQQKDGRFRLNAPAKALLEEENSLRFMVMQHLGQVNWQVLGDLQFTVRTGQPAFSRVHGAELYDFLKEHPAEYEMFDRSMTNLSELAMAPLLMSYSFAPFRRIADIGGGEGFFLQGILRKYTGIQGILFDLPEVLEKAPAGDPSLEGRLQTAKGDFLKSVPVVADLYLLKNILHNWNDLQCMRILSNIREAMPAEGVIGVIEMIVPDDGRPSVAKLLDIQMMVSFPDGRERSLSEFRSIAEQAGLKVRRVIRTVAPLSVIELVPLGDHQDL
jgi:hypothetical protein